MEKFLLEAKSLLLTYHAPKICKGLISSYFKKEDILEQLKKKLLTKNINIVEYFICFESSTTKVTTELSSHFQGNGQFRHTHVYLMLNQQVRVYDKLFFDLNTFDDDQKPIIFHGNFCSANKYVKDRTLKNTNRKSDREACISYLLKEDTEPYSNIDFSYLNEIRKNKPLSEMVYNDRVETLKMYQPLEIKSDKDFSEREIEEFKEKDFPLLKNKKRIVIIFPYQQNVTNKFICFLKNFFENISIKFITDFCRLENYNKEETLVIHNPNQKDIIPLISQIVENQNSLVELNNLTFEIPTNTIISILKENIMNNPQFLNFLKEKQFLDIFELDQDFHVITDPKQQIINIHIDNSNHGQITNYYQENQLLVKRIQELEDKNVQLEDKFQEDRLIIKQLQEKMSLFQETVEKLVEQKVEQKNQLSFLFDVSSKSLESAIVLKDKNQDKSQAKSSIKIKKTKN